MSMKKIAITVEDQNLSIIDMLVREGLYPNRSKAIQAAIQEKLDDLQKMRLFTESVKLDSTEEQTMAENMGGSAL